MTPEICRKMSASLDFRPSWIQLSLTANFSSSFFTCQHLVAQPRSEVVFNSVYRNGHDCVIRSSVYGWIVSKHMFFSKHETCKNAQKIECITIDVVGRGMNYTGLITKSYLKGSMVEER